MDLCNELSLSVQQAGWPAVLHGKNCNIEHYR